MDDADLDFADIDDADVDLDFGDEGDTACEELDEDETLLPEDLTGADAHLVEGAAMHVGAYSMVSRAARVTMVLSHLGACRLLLTAVIASFGCLSWLH